MLKILLRMCDFVFVLRPLILIPAWSFYLIGAAQAKHSAAPAIAAFPAPPVFLSLTLILITSYLLNQVFDRDSDEKNGKCFFLSRGIFQSRTLIILAALSFVAASTVFKNVEGVQRGLLIGALFLSLLYSLPPVRLCARPFADMIANGAGYGGLAYLMGFSVLQPSTVALASPYVLLVAATFLHTAILDVPGDRATDKNTTAVYLGMGRTVWLAASLHFAALIAAVITRNIMALLIVGVLAPVSIYTVRQQSPRASSILVLINTSAVAVAAVVVWPVYAALLAPLVLLSRLYYKKRFGIIYPGPPKNA